MQQLRYLWPLRVAMFLVLPWASPVAAGDRLSAPEQELALKAWADVRAEKLAPIQVRLWSLVRGEKSLQPLTIAQLKEAVANSSPTQGAESRQKFAELVTADHLPLRSEWQEVTLTVVGQTTRVESSHEVRMVSSQEDIRADRKNKQIDIRPLHLSKVHYLQLFDLRHIPQDGMAKFGTVEQRNMQHIALSLTSTKPDTTWKYLLDAKTHQAVEWTETSPSRGTSKYGFQSESIQVGESKLFPRFQVSADFRHGNARLLRATVIETVTAPFEPANPKVLEEVGGQRGDTIVDHRLNPKPPRVFSAPANYTDVRIAQPDLDVNTP
ncbi:MAG: hypothetical protein V4719_32115 [Planctomycetota bacterium]